MSGLSEVRFGANSMGYSILGGAERKSSAWRQAAMRIATVPDGKEIEDRVYRFMGDFHGETACMMLERADGRRAHSFDARLHLAAPEAGPAEPWRPVDPEDLLHGRRVGLDRHRVLRDLSSCGDLLPWIEAAVVSCNSGEGKAQLTGWDPIRQCRAFWALFPFSLTRAVDVVSNEVLPAAGRLDSERGGRFVFEDMEAPDGFEHPGDLRRFARSLAEAVRARDPFVELIEMCESAVEDLGLADFARVVNLRFGHFDSPTARCDELTNLIRTHGLPASLIEFVGRAVIEELGFRTEHELLSAVGVQIPRWSGLGRGNPPVGLVLSDEFCRFAQERLQAIGMGAGSEPVSPLKLEVAVLLHESGSAEAGKLASILRKQVKGRATDLDGSPDDWRDAMERLHRSGLPDNLQDRMLRECERGVLEILWRHVGGAPGDRLKTLLRIRRDLARFGMGIGSQLFEEEMVLDAGSEAFRFYRRTMKGSIDWDLLLPRAHRQGPKAFRVAMGEWLGAFGPGPWRLGRSSDLGRLLDDHVTAAETREAMRYWLRERWSLRANPWLLARAIPGSRALARVKTAARVMLLMVVLGLLAWGGVWAYPRVAPIVKEWVRGPVPVNRGDGGSAADPPTERVEPIFSGEVMPGAETVLPSGANGESGSEGVGVSSGPATDQPDPYALEEAGDQSEQQGADGPGRERDQ